LSSITEIKSRTETAVQTRSQLLHSALAVAKKSEVVLRNASEEIIRVKDFVKTSTVDNYDSVLVKQHLEKLKVRIWKSLISCF